MKFKPPDYWDILKYSFFVLVSIVIMSNIISFLRIINYEYYASFWNVTSGCSAKNPENLVCLSKLVMPGGKYLPSVGK